MSNYTKLRLWLVVFCLSFLLNKLYAQITLSPQAEIHVLTCGPYQGELYSAFGHSAIRVHDPINQLDLLYNYGVFDFNQPNFYLNFTRGNLNYKLAVMDYPRFRDYYIYYNRYIHEQVLNLNQGQKQKLFEFLQWNMLPENQYYRYDYFYDNCATRVRDALISTFGDSIHFDGSYIKTDYTIRDLTEIYLQDQRWGDLGIDICLGLPMDKKATPFMYMFLPDYIESGFNHATLANDSTTVPLVKNTIITYESKPEANSDSLPSPLKTFSVLLLLGIVLTFIGWKKKKAFMLFDIILFTLIGLIGWLLFLLWVATDHHAAANNMNLLWALPFHFPAALLLLKKSYHHWLRKYFMAIAVLSGLLLIFWGILPQQLNYSLIPIVLLLGLRAFFLQYILRISKEA
ncbi:MAG TPA: DUF4105 domain-containing protein [Fulvivirga sp.]|nr:DUF4105 domain-containing protein [Fulvivirga sp.]